VRKHLRYGWYVLPHRWYVLLECWRRGLIWRGLTHDLTKFLGGEWLPYVEHFYGAKARKWRDETGYYKPTDTGDPAFDLAWLRHQHRNDHHWQWWILTEDESGRPVALPMSEAARVEMLCDWIGASRAQGHGGMGGPSGVRAWYAKHGAKMILHSDTRAWVENRLREERGGTPLSRWIGKKPDLNE